MAGAEATKTTAPAGGDEVADRPLRGMALYGLATIFFSLSDITAKYLNQTLVPVEIAWMRYLGFTILMVPLLLRHGPGVFKSQRPMLQLLRGLGLLSAAIFFIHTTRYLPIAEASAIGSVSPILITALSIPFLGEKVGIRRWAAVFVGFTGVLIVMRPGTEAFQPAGLLAICSASGWAVAMIVTRAMRGADGAPTMLGWTAVTGLVVLTALLPFNFVMPGWKEVGLGAFLALVSTTGQWLIVLAYRLTSASLLASFSFIQLIWSTTLGYIVFDAIPDQWTIVGGCFIAASCIYTAHRERVKARG